MHPLVRCPISFAVGIGVAVGVLVLDTGLPNVLPQLEGSLLYPLLIVPLYAVATNLLVVHRNAITQYYRSDVVTRSDRRGMLVGAICGMVLGVQLFISIPAAITSLGLLLLVLALFLGDIEYTLTGSTDWEPQGTPVNTDEDNPALD